MRFRKFTPLQRYRLSERSTPARAALAVGFISCLILALAPLRHVLNVTTVGFALLLGVLFVSVQLGSRPALIASVVAMLGYNFFFLPPTLTLTIQDPQNWVALVAFSVTAVVSGQLSADARRRATEAERSQAEAERLYTELQAAFEIASQAEAIKRSELMKSALLDAVTHDLRTPLTSIRVAATTLHKALRSGQNIGEEFSAELIGVVDEESLHLDQLISGFVELARIEAGDLALQATWSSLQDVANVAIKRARALLTQHHVVTDLPESLPLMHIDARALSEVIYTLLDNARKYSPDGSTILIGAAVFGKEIYVSVVDQGIGLREGDASRIFEKFYRGENASRSRSSGMGIGLAIAKAIVEAHGGAIWVEKDGRPKGTTIAFSIPIREE